MAISLTIVAIFVPASFMPGIAGQFFKQFGITVSVQVLFSLLAARLVTPMLAAYFLRSHSREEPPPGPLLRAYTRLVTWSVRHYFITVVVGLLIFAASIWSTTLLSQGFLPAQDTGRSLLAVELPPGSRLSDTEKVTEEIVAHAAQPSGGGQRVRRRRAFAAGNPGGPSRLGDHQLYQQEQAKYFAAGPGAVHRQEAR